MGLSPEAKPYGTTEKKTSARRNDVAYVSLEIKDPKLKEWSNSPYDVLSYKGGTHKYNGGSTYQYPEGKTLRINDEPVMDTCERPWCEKTIRGMYDGIKGARTDMRTEYESPRILELGYGLGITSLEILRGLDGGQVTPGPRGGEYTVVELNKSISEFAQKTVSDRIKRLHGLDHTDKKIQATVIHGNAYDALEIFAQEIKDGKRKPFDGIVSDLYDPEQSDGTTDLKRMDLMREVLSDNGIFTFFVYHNQSGASGTNRVQEQLLDRYGFGFHIDSALVNPNPSYEYLFQKDDATGEMTPVRRLTTITAYKDNNAASDTVSAAK